MPFPRQASAERYGERAARIRRYVGGALHPEVRVQLLKLAAKYEDLAAAARAERHPPTLVVHRGIMIPDDKPYCFTTPIAGPICLTDQR